MGAISSINFKKSNAIQAQHNDRDLPPSYLIGGENLCNRDSKEALKLKNQIIQEAIEKYTSHTNQKFQAKSYEWSAVCNIKDTTTMQDLERLAEHFQNKYGFQCYQIAIHRDEGHISDSGEKIINHHAHLEFITLNKTNGRNMWRRELITPKVLRQIQDEVAELLQMQRGQDKRISGAKRVEPRAYAKIKEQEKQSRIKLQKENQELTEELCIKISQNAELQQELLSAKEVRACLENFRKDSISKGFPKEFFRDLSAIKKNAEPTTLELLESTLRDLVEKYQEKAQKEQNLQAKIKELESKLAEKEKHLQEILEQLSEKERKIYDLEIQKQQKQELSYLESDLTAKEQKSIESMPKENKIDSRALLDDLNGKTKESYSKSNIESLLSKIEEAKSCQEERHNNPQTNFQDKFTSFKKQQEQKPQQESQRTFTRHR